MKRCFLFINALISCIKSFVIVYLLLIKTKNWQLNQLLRSFIDSFPINRLTIQHNPIQNHLFLSSFAKKTQRYSIMDTKATNFDLREAKIEHFSSSYCQSINLQVNHLFYLYNQKIFDNFVISCFWVVRLCKIYLCDSFLILFCHSLLLLPLLRIYKQYINLLH